MAAIQLTVKNKNTGNVCYSYIKCIGDFDMLYNKLLKIANRILNENQHNWQMYIYNYYHTHWWHVKSIKRLLCAYGKYYFMYGDTGYDYIYTIKL